MSHGFVTVQWSRKKLVYDLFVILGIAAFIAGYVALTQVAIDPAFRPEPAIVMMRAFGTCAFVMMTLILLIGPLARLDRRFLPLLFNRRHFGVIFTFVAIWHAKQVLDFYHAFSPEQLSKWTALFTFDASFTGSSMPFQLFGLAALVIFVVMAATSHDFWQSFLGPKVWKGLHMMVYLAWALTVLHVAFGGLQVEHHPAWVGLMTVCVASVVSLHTIAAFKARAEDSLIARSVSIDGEVWLDAGPLDRFDLDEPVSVLGEEGESIAVVRHAGGISAVHGVCAHQGGPLAEGRVVDGCLTCPWHGWQYRPDDGTSPPPFEERLATHPVRLDDREHVLVRAEADEPGTPQAPVRSLDV